MKTFRLFHLVEHDRFDVTALMTNKAFGDMHSKHEPDQWPFRVWRMRERLRMNARAPIFGLRGSHSDNVLSVDPIPFQIQKYFNEPTEAHVLFPQSACDGLIIAAPPGPFGFFMATADCPIIVMYAVAKDNREYFAFLHASAQCLQKGIIKNARKRLEAVACTPRNIEAATLPGIGNCCYGIGDDYVTALTDKNKLSIFCDVKTRGKNKGIITTTRGPRSDQPAINLPKAISILVNKSGIPHAGLRHYDECTSCSKTEYFSHVRGDVQRNGVMVYIKRRG